MLPKVAVLAATVLAEITTSGLLGTQSDINITKTSKQLIKWYRNIIT